MGRIVSYDPCCYVYAIKRRKLEGPIAGDEIIARATAVASTYTKEAPAFVIHFPRGGTVEVCEGGSLDASAGCIITVIER